MNNVVAKSVCGWARGSCQFPASAISAAGVKIALKEHRAYRHQVEGGFRKRGVIKSDGTVAGTEDGLVKLPPVPERIGE